MKRTSDQSLAFEVQGLSFRYDRTQDRGWALKDIHCSIRTGSIVGIIGPNGSGKTSLLKLFMGLLQPESGAISLFGQELRTMRPATIAQQIALVPQETSQVFPFTIGELVLMGRFPFHQPFDGWGWDSSADVHLATQAMADMEVRTLADRMMSEVSGGERQRAMIARALTQDPRILLLDEPTAFLDLHHQLDIVRKLRQLNQSRGLTVVMVSHDLNLASQCCDQLFLLHQGKIITHGTPSEVIRPEVLEPVYRCQILVDEHPHSHAPRVTLSV
ncbi:ABC transporter ATP-binding protein [Candidatus Nitronereus thalassa]|uniref:ABC transporter ATP-binding protein n=1 Tax=Candidatus Nitronereus thalassa TaxID=3020898 RepID=A0ABU3K4T6_9BACT|nr:ABC transporter ATP-binding protein [Candidatus Nitronereus thalassa]MDT7041419.1 ABC transporter ATP-binding protein [Candidatus Nitronereus thalassa]